MRRVFVRSDGVDRHGSDCDCGLCDSVGKAYSCGIYDWHTSELIERVYGSTEHVADAMAQVRIITGGLIKFRKEEA